MWLQYMNLVLQLDVLTVYALKSAARGYIDIVAVWTEQLHSIQSRHVGTATRYNVTTNTVHAWAASKDASLILLNLRIAPMFSHI